MGDDIWCYNGSPVAISAAGWSSRDSPYQTAIHGNTATHDLVDGNGNVLGSVTYSLYNIFINDQFSDWCGILNVGQISRSYTPREGWSLSASKSGGIATPNGGSGAPNDSGKCANTLGGSAFTNAAAGSGTAVGKLSVTY